MHLLAIHVRQGAVDEEVGRHLHGALKYKEMRVSEAMTPIENVFMLSRDDKLGYETMAKIFKVHTHTHTHTLLCLSLLTHSHTHTHTHTHTHKMQAGYSRIPVYDPSSPHHDIIGLVLAKVITHTHTHTHNTSLSIHPHHHTHTHTHRTCSSSTTTQQSPWKPS
jgi:CBS domain containing-hemolysin-like protein